VPVLLLGPVATAGDPADDLWAAARNNEVKAVEALLAQGVDVNAKTHFGATALWFAAYKGHADVATFLLKHKADPSVRDSVWGETPLSFAVSGGNVALVTALVQAGAHDTDAALLSAASRDRAPVVQAILDAGKPRPETLTAGLVLANGQEVREALRKAGARPASPGEPPVSLRAYDGAFEDIRTGGRLQITVKDDWLIARYSGTAYVLKPGPGDTFPAIGHDNVSAAFNRQKDTVSGLVLKLNKNEVRFERAAELKTATVSGKPADDAPVAVTTPRPWPSFRGPDASGIADGQHPPTTWDVKTGHNVRWKTPIPGLAHSSPIVWGGRVYLTTAVNSEDKTEFRAGQYGAGDPAKDMVRHSWRIYCLDAKTGNTVWKQTAHEGVPKIKRHLKSSHANATPATDGKHLVAFFGSEGLYCYDLDGKQLWKQDLGVIDVGAFNDPDLQWGTASSPVLYQNLVIVQCDRQTDSFLAAYDVDTGKEVWRTPRDEPPSWGTPTVYDGPPRAELIANGARYIRGYDPLTGKELWRLGPNSEITVPAPVVGQGLIFVTNGYRPIQPIYAVLPGANGDISLPEGQESGAQVAWSKQRGGPYQPTPVVYGPYLYVCNNNGILTAFEARTGKEVYRQRLGGKGGYSASLVAADGRVYFTSEEGEIRVVKAGPDFELLALIDMGDACMATPAIADGMIFVRTQHHLYGIGY
jgi:outer membrane protein assembly factor BamB